MEDGGKMAEGGALMAEAGACPEAASARDAPGSARQRRREAPPPPSVLRRLLAAAMLAVSLALTASAFARFATPRGAHATAFVKADGGPDCSFTDCKQSGCDVATHPFLCIDESGAGPTMGCNAAPWPADQCATACTLQNCDKVQRPDDAATCTNYACPAATCVQLQQCGVEHPFQCLVGSARYGCTDDEFGWIFSAPTTCSSCCDTRTCGVQPSPLGGKTDEHGCIPSAGYSWCEPQKKCTRPWEVPCH
mmetsp:Transcript_20081/g.68025  ORF Transcript_20081/g.68025 Transcript_20081/m.68025 type:complete len:250 (+) Transcript_20081:101-850(+)